MSNSQLSSSEIIGLANNQLEKAGDLYRRSRWLQVTTFLLSVTSIFIANPYTYIPALLALGIQVYSWSVRRSAVSRHNEGEEGRTRGQLLDALGSAEERVDLNNWLIRVAPRQGDSPPDPVSPDYFASTAPAGMRRLCDHLQENAFWNKFMYKEAADYYGKILWGFVIAAIAAVLVAIPLASDGQNLILARLIVVALASGAAFTQWSEVAAWRSAETKSELLDRRLEALSDCTDDELRLGRIGALLSAYGDYCVATSGAPPTPTWLYKRHGAHVNQLWARRLAT
ncbi:hypothetical protein ACFYWH_11205 [Streptomyces sp. NPDC003737]|uniref:hypothetical protein n=1 Tax=Streptomyces sp. NPDC003737 TaxID=3364685 RepID=UPI0036A083AB